MGRDKRRDNNHNNKMIEPTRSYFFEAVLGLASLVIFFILTMP